MPPENTTTKSHRPLAKQDPGHIAAIILEVLGGLRTPGEAATLLGVSLVRYYSLENQAIAGLVDGCTPKKIGRQQSQNSQIMALRKENDQLKRDLIRHQSLVRTAQRAAGIKAALPDRHKQNETAKKQGRRKPRKPSVRALRQVKRLTTSAQDNEKTSTTPPI